MAPGRYAYSGRTRSLARSDADRAPLSSHVSRTAFGQHQPSLPNRSLYELNQFAL
jgi:hypothetical protein